MHTIIQLIGWLLFYLLQLYQSAIYICKQRRDDLHSWVSENTAT